MTVIRPSGGIDRELDIRAARLDADAADDPPGQIAHPLVLAIGQGQGRRDGDAVAGVHAHRIDVLDRADDHEVVGPVTHDLELELLPANHRLFEQDLVHRAQIETTPGQLAEFFDVVGDAAADATECERRPDDAREAQDLDRREGFLDRAHVAALRHVCADRLHRFPELQAILGDLDGFDRGADQLDAILGQRAVLAQRHREVQRGLAADRRQHRIRPLTFDDLRQNLGGQRLDVRAVGQLRVGHDRRRVAVDEDDLEPLGAKRLAGLSTGIVELARLPDDDGAGADHEDAFDVGALGHFVTDEVVKSEDLGDPADGIRSRFRVQRSGFDALVLRLFQHLHAEPAARAPNVNPAP